MSDINETNAKRFINAYNTIDYALRTVFNMKRSISFSEAVRKGAQVNSVVSKFEDKLIDYGRLRNSIVHSGNSEYIMAEPHDDITDDIEKIAKLITTPPLAISIARKANIIGVESSIKLREVLKKIHETGYKNLPVFENEVIIGVANLRFIGAVICEQVFLNNDINEFINKSEISEVVRRDKESESFTIKSERLTIEEALTLFYENHKLGAILITKNGTFLERPIGILTIGDIILLNKTIDEY